MNLRKTLTLTCIYGVLSTSFGACASDPQTLSPPQDWPARKTLVHTNCASLDGYFRNSATRSTAYRSPNVPRSSTAFLTSLLTDGFEYSNDARADSATSVRLDASRLQALALDDNVQHELTASSNQLLRCSPNGTIVVAFSSLASGESFANGKRIVTIELIEATDPSLIARQTVSTCAVHFGLVPGCHRIENWFLFARERGSCKAWGRSASVVGENVERGPSFLAWRQPRRSWQNIWR